MKDETTIDETRREPWLSTVLRMLVHGITAAVFVWPLATQPTVIGAGIASAMGALFGRFSGHSRVRLPVVLGGALVGWLTTLFVTRLVTSTSLVAPSLGPQDALALGDATLFAGSSFFVSLALRAASIRRPALTVLEVAFIALSFAQLVVAHRNGAINRPFEIADPILTQGGDPTIVFLVIGAVATAVVVALLLSERSAVRSSLHLGIAAAILFAVLGTTQMFGLPPPPPTGEGLGLRGDREDSQGQGNQGGGRRDNEDLEFRDNYSSSGDQVPVAIVLLRDDYSPPTGVYYLRQGAFSQFNGNRLVGSTRSDTDRDVASRFPSSEVRIPDVPEAGSYRIAVETTVALLADHNRPFALEAPVRLEPERNPDPSRFRRVYRVESVALTSDYASLLGARVGSSRWSPEQLAHYLEAPTDARYGELANRIVREELDDDLRDDPIARAVAVVSFLGREGKYSLRSGHASATDPTADFLFGDMTGYCVHFAHAATYLMRTLGIPARVATGYAIDESSRQGGSALLVSGAASHAWPEIYVDGVGWVVFDVAPQTVLDQMPSPPDPDLQRLLAALLRNEVPLPTDGRPAPPIMARARDALKIALGVVAAVFASLVLVLVFAKLYRALLPAFASEKHKARVVYRAMLDRLADLHVRREYGETREAFARRIAEKSPSFARLTTLHVGAAFGGTARLGAVDEAARAVRAELRGAFPLWRRIGGALLPWTWLMSR